MSDTDLPDLHVVADPVTVGGDEPEDDDGCNAVELRVADMIASGATVEETAKECGKSIRTIRRWKKNPKIAAVIRARAAEAVAMGRAVLSSGMHRASRALVQMADGTAEASAPRVSAARAVVEVTAKLVELEGVSERLAQLEEQLANQPGKPGFNRGRV